MDVVSLFCKVDLYFAKECNCKLDLPIIPELFDFVIDIQETLHTVLTQVLSVLWHLSGSTLFSHSVFSNIEGKYSNEAEIFIAVCRYGQSSIFFCCEYLQE